VPSQAELLRLLLEPNESLTLEYKSWLDLADNKGRATLAKAAIALANEGGGIIVLGMRAAEGAPLTSQVQPHRIGRYDQDAINAAVNRFAEPAIHCELSFAFHPETHVEHAFVSVAGGMKVPIMSKRDQQDEIMAQRCYVRKPGAKIRRTLHC
jgi:Schlafen, AlbA_2